MKYPGLLLMTGDWLKEPSLTLCSLAARGFWVDILCVMHEMDRSGEVTGAIEELAQLARCKPDAAESAILELEARKVADVVRHSARDLSGKITLINRRMKREFKKRYVNNMRQSRFHGKEQNNGFMAFDMTVRTNDLTNKEGDSKGETLVLFERVRKDLYALYNRPDTQPLTYGEQFDMAEICRRPDALAELDTIIQYRKSLPPHEVRFFPRTFRTFLTKWPDVLDLARNYCPNQGATPATPYARLMALNEEILKHPCNEDSRYHTGKETLEQWAEFKELKVEREKVNRQVAMGK